MGGGEKLVVHVCRSAPCLVHARHCPVNSEIAMVHVAGTPCQAVSSMGLQDFQHAMSYSHFLTWVAIRKLCEEPVLIQENVEDFDRRELMQLLDQYDWSFGMISPCQLGWPVRRVRQWCVCLGCCNGVASLLLCQTNRACLERCCAFRGRHKAKTLAFRSLLNIFSDMFHQRVSDDWEVFFWLLLD